MDVVTYALCKKLVSSIVSGIKSMRVDGLTLYITTQDDQVLESHFPTPAYGISIVDLNIYANKHLICTMSDSTTIDAGEVPYYVPQKGVDYYTEADKQELINEISEEVQDSFALKLMI